MNFKDFAIPVFDYGTLHLQVNTPLYILGLVLVAMFFLHFWLFRPVLKTLDRRKAMLEKMEEETGANQEEVARLLEDYQANLTKVREEVATVRKEAYKQARLAADAILADAKSKAEADLNNQLKELEADVAQARQVLEASTQQLAQKATDRVLGA